PASELFLFVSGAARPPPLARRPPPGGSVSPLPRRFPFRPRGSEDGNPHRRERAADPRRPEERVGPPSGGFLQAPGLAGARWSGRGLRPSLRLPGPSAGAGVHVPAPLQRCRLGEGPVGER